MYSDIEKTGGTIIKAKMYKTYTFSLLIVSQMERQAKKKKS